MGRGVVYTLPADGTQHVPKPTPSGFTEEAARVAEAKGANGVHVDYAKPLPWTAGQPQAVRKLFTSEDPLFMHKTLGLLSLVSFVYRYYFVYNARGDLGFDGSIFDWCTLFLHLALSTSSLIFHVLRHRLRGKPMVIWEEYRLHAIVFTLSSVSVAVWGLLAAPLLDGHPNLHQVLQCGVVFAHRLVVDEITRRFGAPDGSTTVRVGNKDCNPFRLFVRRFYSFYQFLAMGSHLVPHARTADLGFNSIIAIQSSAFLMTLFRKGLVRWYTHQGWYSACLVLSGYHIVRSFSAQPCVLAGIVCVFVARVRMGRGKYELWATFAIATLPATRELAGAALARVLPSAA